MNLETEIGWGWGGGGGGGVDRKINTVPYTSVVRLGNVTVYKVLNLDVTI